jgi:hypothetical protein
MVETGSNTTASATTQSGSHGDFLVSSKRRRIGAAEIVAHSLRSPASRNASNRIGRFRAAGRRLGQKAIFIGKLPRQVFFDNVVEAPLSQRLLLGTHAHL